MEQVVYHIPALLVETIAGLAIKDDGTYVDVTFGGGGHSRAIMEHLGPNGRLVGMDQDMDAWSNRLQDDRFTFAHGNFAYLKNFLRYYGIDGVDGILADLGVSFHHFDDVERGFTFRADAPLDMRMNRNASFTARDLLNTYDVDRLADVLFLYGELRQSRRLAAVIVKSRPLSTTGQLVEVVRPLLKPSQEKKELSMVFQALRIEVNGELDALRKLLMQSAEVLNPGGRLAVITYHSLEDRLVKNSCAPATSRASRRRTSTDVSTRRGEWSPARSSRRVRPRWHAIPVRAVPSCALPSSWSARQEAINLSTTLNASIQDR